MRIYVRLEPLHRPVPVDVDSSTLVSDLCERIGAQALYCPAARKGIAQDSQGDAGPEPLDRGTHETWA
eukprot:5014031-Amphidinium_carterae.1